MKYTKECPCCHKKELYLRLSTIGHIAILSEWECLNCGYTENPRVYWVDGREN